MLKDYISTMTEVADSVDLSDVQVKYKKWEHLYKRFYPIVKLLQTRGHTNGIDFGCGTGALTVIGSLNNINIIGVDIPILSGNVENSYAVVQKELILKGYPFKLFDTSKSNWPFADNEFEFIVAFNSLSEDYSDKSKENHLPWDGKIMSSRKVELMRILKPRSLWIVGPARKFRSLQRSAFGKEIVKSGHELKPWISSGVFRRNNKIVRGTK